jgi:outer membrane protein TolC
VKEIAMYRFTRRLTGAGLLAALLVCGGAVAQEGSSGGTLELTLNEAMEIAFQNNLDIRIVGFDRFVAEERVTTAKGTFEPSLFVGLPGLTSLNPYPGGGAFGSGNGFGGLGFADTVVPPSNLFDDPNGTTTNSFATLVDFQQQLPFGLRYDVSYNVARSSTNSLFQSLNPSWNNTLAVSVIQPLLSGRGEEATAAALLVAQANTEVSYAAFEAQVEEILLQVENAYWDLVFAERDLAVKQSSLDLAREQLDRTVAQVEVGLIAPVQRTQAEVQVAARETDVIVARNALENARDAVRAALHAERLPDGWATEIEAVDEPTPTLGSVDLESAIDDAMANRAEMRQFQATIDAREIEVAAARNALQPRLDLIGQLSSAGIGGDQVIRDDFFGPVIDTIEGGYGDAISQLFGFDFVSWRIGLNMTIPIGNSTAKGNYAQATINEDRARAELQRTEQRIEQEVRRAAREVQAAADAVASTTKTRELAERQLEIETDRFDVGMSTNFEVLRFQDDLAIARSDELRARLALRRTEASLYRATGTLLGRYGIEIRNGEDTE